MSDLTSTFYCYPRSNEFVRELALPRSLIVKSNGENTLLIYMYDFISMPNSIDGSILRLASPAIYTCSRLVGAK